MKGIIGKPLHRLSRSPAQRGDCGMIQVNQVICDWKFFPVQLMERLNRRCVYRFFSGNVTHSHEHTLMDIEDLPYLAARSAQRRMISRISAYTGDSGRGAHAI
jgi:hypothetical protein